jgi:hypothetical protein
MHAEQHLTQQHGNGMRQRSSAPSMSIHNSRREQQRCMQLPYAEKGQSSIRVAAAAVTTGSVLVSCCRVNRTPILVASRSRSHFRHLQHVEHTDLSRSADSA